MRLKTAVNLARRAPPTDWSLSPDWERLFHQMKDAIDDGQLRVIVPLGETRYRFFNVRLADLWRWVRGKDEEWEAVRRLCAEWAAAREIDLEEIPEGDTAGPSLKRAAGPKRPPDREAAIRDFVAKGKVPPAVPWKTCVNAVRQQCGKKTSDRGFSDATIEREVKKIIKNGYEE